MVTECISIDGLVEASGGVQNYEHLNWAFPFEHGDESQKFKDDETFGSNAPSIRADVGGTATTLQNPECANTQVIDGDVVTEVTRA